MIVALENNIYSVFEKDLPKKPDVLLEALQKKAAADLIIAIPTAPLWSLADMTSLVNYQQQQNRLLVWILDATSSFFMSIEWHRVPTFQEALDYVQFEQMQRDLGF